MPIAGSQEEVYQGDGELIPSPEVKLESFVRSLSGGRRTDSQQIDNDVWDLEKSIRGTEN